MIIEPKVREYICTTAHPQGCAESVRNQADYACKQGIVNGTKKALIIGCSTGYGLASRICALENCGADTLGIMFERQANGRRTATPGWYNTAEFHRLASGKGVYAKTINGDAFSKEIKEKAIELIKKDLGKVDLVVYSLAAPRRTDAEGKTWSSCLKTTDEPFTEKSLDLRNNEITEKTVEPATEEEVLSTVKVMGGEDWADWIDALKAADVLTENAVTVAYSYIGPELTYPIYYHGTIGSSTMPQKINPKLAKGIIANSQKLYSLPATGLYSGVRMFEGDSSSYMLFDGLMEEGMELATEVIIRAEELTRTLYVNKERLLKNANINEGLDNSEYVMMNVAAKLGKDAAHQLLYDKAMKTELEGKNYLQVLSDDEVLSSMFTKEELEKMIAPSSYTGICSVLARELADKAEAKAKMMTEK